MSGDTKHTPGPWCGGSSNIPVTEMAVCGKVPDRKHSTIVRFVCANEYGISFDEAYANMALIKEAPELLSCLRLLVSAITMAIPDAECEELIMRAREAIRKATLGADE